MKAILVTVALVVATLLPSFATAAPYDLVAIYAKDKSQKEVSIDDLKTSPDDNVVIPNAFTADDGTYHLTSIEERLDLDDVDHVDKSYLLPMWRFSVYQATDTNTFPEEGVPLDAKTTKKTWSLTDIQASHSTSDAVTTVRFMTRGSFSPEFMCGRETVYREQHGKALDAVEKDAGAAGRDTPTASIAAVYRSGSGAAPKKFILSGNHIILYSFCDALLTGDSVDWAEATKHTYFQVGGGSADELREAHHRRLAELLFGDDFDRNGLKLAKVTKPGTGTNVVIEGVQSFSIMDLSAFALIERDNQKSGTGESVGKVIDRNSTLEVDFSRLHNQCGFAVSAPYSLVITTTDDNKNPITIKSPVNVSTPCRPELNVKWSDYLGKEIRVQLLYQLPGLGGKVLVSQSPSFTVRELGLITTFPIVSEVVSLATSTNPKSLNATSSIPISWTMKLNGQGGFSAAYTAVTFPWKLSYNFREAPEFAKYFAIYPHISIVVPADGKNPTYAVGGGVSLAQFFNFAYGFHPIDHVSYLFIGVGIQDIVKVLK